MEEDAKCVCVCVQCEAEKGRAEEQFEAGRILEKQGFIDDAIGWYRKAAEQGHAKAQCNLGACYNDGRGVQADERKAVELFTKAAAQGSNGALCNLAMCYEEGRGVEKDVHKAVELYTKAAEQGNAQAQCNLAVCYEEGSGVEKDMRKAVEWHTKAAEQGFVQAQCNLASCYEEGRGVEKSDEMAVYWWNEAVKQGNPDAELQMGLRYIQGRGVPVDRPKGIHLLALSAARGYADAMEALLFEARMGDAMAQYHLGQWYYFGQSGPHRGRVRRALCWWQRSARQGYAEAQAELGLHYLKQRKTNAARKFLTRAADQGNERARQALSQLRR